MLALCNNNNTREHLIVSVAVIAKPQVHCLGLFLLFESTSICFYQAAKSGRRARLAADQSSFEESRHVRKASTSTSTGDVCYHATTECRQNVLPFESIMLYVFWFCLTHESQDDDQVGGIRKSWDCACLLLFLRTITLSHLQWRSPSLIVTVVFFLRPAGPS